MTTTWNENDHPRTINGVPGAGRFEGKRSTPSSLTLAAPGKPSWETHGDAVNAAADRMELHSGERYDYKSTSLLVNPDGHAEANINLSGPTGTGAMQLRHDYATGVSTLANLADKTRTNNPDVVNAAVRDVYGMNRSSKDLFWRLREETVADAGVHPTVQESLTRDNHVYPNHRIHLDALDDAADKTGIRSGHAYEYKFTSMQTNPKGEAEAFIHLDDGEDTYLTHNYGTGVTTYTSHDRGIVDSTDEDLITVAVEDIDPTHSDGADGMFNRLRENSLANEGLDHRMRTSLLRPPTPRSVNIADLTETPRTVAAKEHGIKGLGDIAVSRAGNDIRVEMNLPERVIVPDLSTWDDGNSNVDAHSEMMSVLEEHLGIQPGDTDALSVRNGQPTYTHYESLGSSAEIDLEDLTAWSSDFVALADPAVVGRLAGEIAERYENG